LLADQMALRADSLGLHYFVLFSFTTHIHSVHESRPTSALIAHTHAVHNQHTSQGKLHLIKQT